MAEEILEIFDDNFKSIGQSTYNAVHQNGFWHQVIHCWIIDSSSFSIIYQKRSEKKSIYPNMLDVSVAGHCKFHEEPKQTVIREAFEELGVSIKSNRLQKLGLRRETFSKGDIINREFQHIFFYLLNITETQICLQKEELQYLVLIKPEDVIKSITTDCSIEAKKIGKGKISEITISHIEFIPSIDNYNLKIPIAISDYLKTNSKFYF
jgi:isopentenyldiphosphate isomerase